MMFVCPANDKQLLRIAAARLARWNLDAGADHADDPTQPADRRLNGVIYNGCIASSSGMRRTQR